MIAFNKVKYIYLRSIQLLNRSYSSKNHANNTTMSALIQKLNLITGKSDWVVQSEDYDYHQEVARASFADMLHDTERNVMYEQALKIAIDHMHKNGKKANVLDIGTGTGLLSMMAVRHGADTVIACEVFRPMGECAKEVLKLNGYEGNIKVIPKRSTDLTVGENGDLKFKANILVTEVFDTELIGEGALSIFKHAHDVLLEKDCIVVPHSATVYAQVVESPLVNDWNRLKNIYDENGQLLLNIPDTVKDCKGAAYVHDVQLSQFPLEYINTIISPQAVFRFDFSGKTPFIYNRCSINTIKAEHSGNAQAVFMWWDLNMDIDNQLKLSCAPYWAHPSYKSNPKTIIPWRDHWMQAIYYLPQEVDVKKDEEIHLMSEHDEFSLWFNLRKDLHFTEKDYECPICDCGLHLAFSRTRIGQFNDGTRIKKYMKILENNVDKNSVVLILSHGFYLGLIASKLGAKKVICYESNNLSKRFLQECIAKNELNNVEIVVDIKSLHLDDKITVVIGEPYFVRSILPWDNLHFLYLLNEFKDMFDAGVKIFPKKAIIKGVAMQFVDLHKIRAPLHTCQGFKMAPFDRLMQNSSEVSDENVEPQPLWEYPGKALSNAEEIATIELNLNRLNMETTGQFNIDKKFGECNGIALWVDWVLDVDNVRRNTVSSGPKGPFEIGQNILWDMHTRQGVCLLGNTYNEQHVIKYNFKYDYNNGSISFKIAPQ